MSNIASPKRIEPFAQHGAISARTAAIALATFVLCLLLISFKPYQPLPEPGSQTANRAPLPTPSAAATCPGALSTRT